jgi:RIO kinase 1
VIIDLPQAVNAASNNNAERMFQRDVDNMRRYFGHFAPELLETDYAGEIWALYESGKLQPDSPLTGEFSRDETSADVNEMMEVIDAAKEEERERREREQDDEED